MSSSEELYTKGARIWIPDPDRVWRGAELLRDYKTGDNEMAILLEDGETMTLPLGRAGAPSKDVKLPPLRNPEILIGERARLVVHTNLILVGRRGVLFMFSFYLVRWQ